MTWIHLQDLNGVEVKKWESYSWFIKLAASYHMVTAPVEVEEEINDCHHILLPYLMVRVRRDASILTITSSMNALNTCLLSSFIEGKQVWKFTKNLNFEAEKAAAREKYQTLKLLWLVEFEI